MNSPNNNEKTKSASSKNREVQALIGYFIKDFRHKGIIILTNMSKDEQTVIINWAQDVVDQYGSVLMEYPLKIKNLIDLPCPKENIQIAIKTLLSAYVAKGSDDIVNLLKDRYVRLSAFQDICPEDKKNIIKESNELDETSESTDISLFPNYHKYMQIIISEQKILLEDINTFINELQTQVKKRILKAM